MIFFFLNVEKIHELYTLTHHEPAFFPVQYFGLDLANKGDLSTPGFLEVVIVCSPTGERETGISDKEYCITVIMKWLRD